MFGTSKATPYLYYDIIRIFFTVLYSKLLFRFFCFKLLVNRP